MSQIADLINKLQAEPINLSQSEIARRTGMSQPQVSRWGSGGVADAVEDALKLIALARELGVEVDYLADKAISTEGAPAVPAAQAVA